MSALGADLSAITEAIARGKGTFVLAKTVEADGVSKPSSKPFVLATGAIRAVTVNKGVVITIGLSRDQVEKLRTMCDEALLAPRDSREPYRVFVRSNWRDTP